MDYDFCIDSNTVRLIGSPVEHMGRVEVFDRTSNQWGTICTSDISSQYTLARIVCKSLGYASYRSYGSASNYLNITSSLYSPTVTGPIRCSYIIDSYVYQNLYHCSDFESHMGTNISRCTPDQEWIVTCTCKFLFL